MNPFDYVNAIYEKKTIDNLAGFNPYLCNWSLSNNLDTVLIANEMNALSNLPPEAQYDFHFGAVRKGKRWGKWHKPTEHPHLELVMKHFKYSKQKALEALTVLTQGDLRQIAQMYEHNK